MPFSKTTSAHLLNVLCKYLPAESVVVRKNHGNAAGNPLIESNKASEKTAIDFKRLDINQDT
jgi:hypothetical protein